MEGLVKSMPAKSSLKKNNTMEIVKLFAACGVVMIHYGFPGIIGKVIYGLARFGVPFFLMISGYFVYNTDSATVISKLPGKILKILKMWLITDLLYLVFNFIMQGCDFHYFASEISKWGMGRWYSFLVFQSTWLGFTWYLFALLLCYIVTFLIAKLNMWKYCIPLSLVLLAINLYVGEILPFITGQESIWNWCSNFWVLAFPFYSLGFCVKIYEDTLLSIINDKLMIIILVAGFMLNMVERALTHANQLFLSNIIMTFALFVYSVAYPNRFDESGKFGKIIRPMIYLGGYSMYIYLMHPAFKELAIHIRTVTGAYDNKILTSISVLFVLIGTVGVTYLVGRINDRIKMTR